MCDACDFFRQLNGYDIADCPAVLEAEQREIDMEFWNAELDRLEISGPKFDLVVALRNKGELAPDELPF